jgi:toxin YoeB
MRFHIVVTPEADKDIKALIKSEPAAYLKTMRLFQELAVHPETGTGHPKPLGGNRAGQWSRHISHKHRLVYEIQAEIITVLILSTYGHYDDK